MTDTKMASTQDQANLSAVRSEGSGSIEAAHTPTPWFANQCGIFGRPPSKPGDPWENSIACTGDDDEGNENTANEQVANAAFIVRACNSYDDNQKLIAEMLAALKVARIHAPSIRLAPERRHTISILDTIITRAEGRQP